MQYTFVALARQDALTRAIEEQLVTAAPKDDGPGTSDYQREHLAWARKGQAGEGQGGCDPQQGDGGVKPVAVASIPETLLLARHRERYNRWNRSYGHIDRRTRCHERLSRLIVYSQTRAKDT